jgi:hypothetical protein
MTVETDAPKVATAVSTVQVRQGEEGAFAGWLTELNRIVATFSGHISAVVIPSIPPLQSDWVMVQRISDARAVGSLARFGCTSLATGQEHLTAGGRGHDQRDRRSIYGTLPARCGDRDHHG